MANLLSQFVGGNSGTIPVEVFIVGGGGGAGAGYVTQISSGGGSGQVVYGVYDFNYNKSVNVSIGSSGLGSVYTDGPEPSVGNAGGDTRFGAIVAYGGGGGAGYQISNQWHPYFVERQNYGSSGGTNGQNSHASACCNFPLGSEFVVRASDQGPGATPSNVDETGVWGSQPGSTEGSAMVGGLIIGRKITPNGFIATGAGNHGSGNDAGGGGGAGGHPGASFLDRANSRVDYMGSLSGGLQWYCKGGRGLPGSAIGYPTLEFAGGGGGGGPSYQPGNAGGGDGRSVGTGNDATANTGSGGGGTKGNGGTTVQRGGNGASGVCIIRYPTSYNAATVSGNVATPAQSGYHVYRWNGPGSITFNP